MFEDTRDYFDSRLYKIDNVKSELLSLFYEMEEHGFSEKTS